MVLETGIGNSAVYLEALRSHSGFITVDSGFMNGTLARTGHTVR
jgi:hypothetical protein